MPILFQSMILRADLRLNTRALYLFGDNDQRAGYGGQAKEMRGEPNAVGIRTKWEPNMREAAFYREGERPGTSPPAEFIAKIEEDFAPVRAALGRNEIVIVPASGLGTGAAKLKEFAPVTLRYLETLVARASRGWLEVPPSNIG